MIALVLGSAECVWDDFADAEAFLASCGKTWDGIVAVNSIGADCPHIDYWVTLHPELLPGWVEQRKRPDFEPVGSIIAHRGNTLEPNGYRVAVDEVIEYRWPEMSTSGSSGLFGVKVAVEKGFTHRILCGIPMTPTLHRDDGKPWAQCSSFTRAWTDALPRYAAGTRSMSGMTRDLLGAPSAEWLNP